ncbi:HutD family protein [Erwinia sp. P6884]|uniref:HutD/Ves family protein n=1 Tax=Erwinia sp. P6884 TaxID=3141450 RepID=UPI0031938BEA
MIHFFNSSTLPRTLWRNGGGETQEIISFPPGGKTFSWRLSIATLARDGAFSLFPGVDRIITLLEGDGVTLTAREKYSQSLRHGCPFAFAGEDEVFARLAGGGSSGFNIMTRRATHQASTSCCRESFAFSTREAGVLCVLTGKWLLGDSVLLKGQGVWWESGATLRLTACGDALLLYGEIRAKPQDVEPE